MRKRRIIFITTAQEWLEINMTLRRYCRYQIECNMISIMGYPILIKKMYDAEQMKWSNLDNEYVAPLIDTTISHGLKKVINSYDTFEQISNDNRELENRFYQSGTTNTETQVITREEDKFHPITTTTISNGVVNGQDSSFDNNFWSDLDIKKDFITYEK